MKTVDKNELKYKVIVLGSSGVGKSTILARYIDQKWSPQKTTIGIDYALKEVSYNRTKFILQLWDTAGQQRYGKIVSNYFIKSKVAIIVFDITENNSFKQAKKWIQKFYDVCPLDLPMLLLTNKCDLLDASQLKVKIKQLQPQVQEIKKIYNCKHFLVSAYTGQNIKQAFAHIIQQLYINYIEKQKSIQEKSKPFKLKHIETSITQVSKKKWCCK